MHYITVIVGTLLFIAGAQAEQLDDLSAEAQACYDALVDAFNPINQLVNDCREKYPKSNRGEEQREEYNSCTSAWENSPEFKGVVKNCESEHFESYTTEKTYAFLRRVYNYYLENGIDLDAV